MPSEDSWGPWIEHDGKGCPPHVVGRLIQAVMETAPGHLIEIEEIVALDPPSCSVWNWKAWGRFCICAGLLIGRVVRYRLHEPKAMEGLRALVEEPQEAPPLPVEETVDA